MAQVGSLCEALANASAKSWAKALSKGMAKALTKSLARALGDFSTPLATTHSGTPLVHPSASDPDPQLAEAII